MNAYTSSMANYSGGATSAATSFSPTGGLADTTTKKAAPVSLPTGGIRTAFHSGVTGASKSSTEPSAAKKSKVEDGTPSQGTSGVPLPQGLMHPGMFVNQQPSGSLAPLPQAGASPTVTTASGVALPVGVGIRLGGVGGIAPATAQMSARAPGVQGQYALWGAANGAVAEQAVAERRQRNREHAKRSRVRKKFMLEALQEQVRELQRENRDLRMLVQEHIPEHAMQIITECDSGKHVLFEAEVNGEDSEAKEGKQLERTDHVLMQSLTNGQQCFVLSDPKLPDNPIVFASPGFYKLTGYTSKEVLGRNCRFLQGPGTDARAVEVIRKAVSTGSDATVCLLNYKADGTPFWNQFFLAALRDSENCIVNYVSIMTMTNVMPSRRFSRKFFLFTRLGFNVRLIRRLPLRAWKIK